MHRKSGLVLRNNRMRRSTFWTGLPPLEVSRSAASSSTLTSLLSAAGLALIPFTIVRVRGVFGIRSDQESAAEAYSGSLGQAVVTTQASAIGVTAVPTPETDRESDEFFVYESLAGNQGFITGVGFQEMGRWSTYDSKAMRKVQDGQDVISVIETSSISNGAIFHLSFRMLLKLH